MLHGQVKVATVTFLFTDIEGSTRLWEAHPETMRGVLARHDFLVRQAIEQAKGRVFKTVGDAFHAVFESAQDSLTAVVAAQLAIASEPWPAETPIRVRMALHTGPVESRDDDFFGPALNRVARLLATGHGGQSILSSATQELVRDSLPDGLELRYLGEHRLKDLGSPESVFQICHPDLPAAFPRLRSLESPVFLNNLPQQVTSFVGREAEVAEVKALLERTRLLTLTGSGGTGKTRLALQVASEMLDVSPNGALLVELASLAEGGLVAGTLASHLGSKEHAGTPLEETVVEHLRNKRLLLVLDNCEHVLEACAKLAAAILRNCPDVLILATSRQAFGISGETTYRVPSLSLPDPARPHNPESLSRFEAVRLFIDRAEQAKTDFAVTDQNANALAIICQRLDGIPLAVELAAARVRYLSLEEINGKLDQRFQLLTGGSRTALRRQQTLRSLIDWSYDLLSDEEKSLLQRLSVFAGGWTLEAAESLCEDTGEWMTLDLLTSLCDKSLVLVEEQAGATRYRLLETVRQYAADRLREAGDAEYWRDRHLQTFLEMALAAERDLRGPMQNQWFDRLEADHDNLRAALDWSVTAPERTESGLRLAGGIWRFWYVRGHLLEGWERLIRSLDAAPDADPVVRATAMNGAGNIAYQLADYPAAEKLHEECLALRRRLGDPARIADSLNNLGNSYYEIPDFMASRALHEEALAVRRELDDKIGIASSLNNLGNVAFELGEYDLSRSLQSEALARCRELGHTVGIARSLINLGNVFYEMREYAEARALQQESLRIRVELGERVGIANCLERLAAIAAATGDTDMGAKLWGAEERMREELDLRRPPNEAKRYESQVTAARADFREGFEDAWEIGRSMTMEESIEFALRDSQPSVGRE